MFVVTLLPKTDAVKVFLSSASWAIGIACIVGVLASIFLWALVGGAFSRLRAWRDTRAVISLEKEVAEMMDARTPQRTVRFRFAGGEREGVVREIRGRRFRIAVWVGLRERSVWRKAHEVRELET